jgi:predicted nucleic acid-binding protein
MAWVVDTCLLIDIFEGDPVFGMPSADLLALHAPDGLTISPVTYAELAPAFEGDRGLQDEFLGGVGIALREPWVWDDTLRAHFAWHGYVLRRRAGQAPKRPLADILIGAFALRFQGLLTRNPSDFRLVFSELPLRLPADT